MSLFAPLVISSNCSSSAMRPPIAIAMRSSTAWRFQLRRSSLGNIWVSPSAGPRGMMVTLCTGSHCGTRRATSACPASCQAGVFLSFSLVILLRRPEPPEGVDLVDEDDAGSVLLPLLEEIAPPARAHADEHLDEVGARDAEERHSGLAGDGAGEQRLARPRRAHQEDALGDAPAELGELLRVLEELDDLFQLVLGLVDAGDVREGDLVVVLAEQLRLGLAEAHRLAAACLQLAHEADE